MMVLTNYNEEMEMDKIIIDHIIIIIITMIIIEEEVEASQIEEIMMEMKII